MRCPAGEWEALGASSRGVAGPNLGFGFYPDDCAMWRVGEDGGGLRERVEAQRPGRRQMQERRDHALDQSQLCWGCRVTACEGLAGWMRWL